MNKSDNKFDRFKRFYRENKFHLLMKEKKGTYWLKLRSISRKALMIEFCKFAKINCDSKSSKLFECIYKQQPKQNLLDRFIEKKYTEERQERKTEEGKLISELYKLHTFDWGGLYQNNFDRNVINNYVKKIKNLSLLSKKIDTEIHQSMRSYILSSWFNHWTSILIEDIFKDHKKVTAAIGLIKKVDFFIGDIPFDLKVTYFPNGFMQMKRKELGLNPEIREIKQFALKKGINYDRGQKEKGIFAELLAKFKESVDSETKQFLKQFNHIRKKIIKDTIAKPRNLVRWLYEQQGERRFDAANRLFLVLIDGENLEESWKMKRNIDILKGGINRYLDDLDLVDTRRLKIKFDWMDEKRYSVLSDTVFITKEQL